MIAEDLTPRYADMLAALGAEPRLRILRALLQAHPQGLVVGEIQQAVEAPASTLSHHLKRLETEGLARIERQGTFLRYRADTDALRDLLGFLFAECCSRAGVVDPKDVLRCC